MEIETKSFWKFAQDSRLRIYGGKCFGDTHRVPADMVVNQEIAEENSIGEINSLFSLPDDMIRQVFDEIHETKFLFNCFMVSKDFASVVLDSKRVSLEIPSWRPVCSCHRESTIRRRLLSSWLGKLFNFLSKPFICVWWLLVYPFRQPERHYPDVIATKPPAIKNFLKKFSCIESLSIDLSFSGVMACPRFEPLVRWKFDKSGFIFISAKNRDLLFGDNEEDLGDVEDVIGLTSAEAFHELDSVQYHFMDGVWRMVFVESILEDFPSLKNVVVMDCMNQGRVVMDEEEILRIRDIDKPLEDIVSCCIRVWHLPVVKLPLSGCIVKDATLCIFKEVGTDDGLLVENAFEEREYSELARTIVKKAAFYQLNISATEVDGRFRFVVG